MPVPAGSRFGPYEVVAPLGAGGMGEVYRARDTRLERTVAIKVLPAHIAGDPEFRQRLEREARTVSALDHPHICALHDIGEQDGMMYLVMQYLEGETLAERLKRGALPLDESLQIAIQIAEALDAAHRQGIVHRDLKPGNVMLTKAGAKLLDFGLAKAGDKRWAMGAGEDRSVPPTATTPMPGAAGVPLTRQGTILGTLQYMAPEQLERGEADARADIFAFGCVLYEMLVGRRAFEGASQASIIAAILSADPPAVSTLTPISPPALDYLVGRALAKKPDERWSAMHDVVLQLRWIAAHGGGAGRARESKAPARKKWPQWAAGVALIALGAAAAAGIGALRAPDVRPAPIHFEVAAPAGATFITAGFSVAYLRPVVSHDGTRILMVARGPDGVSRLWVRPLAAAESQLLPGTEDAYFPFWSPDDRSVAFFARGRLWRLDLAGGSPRVLCDAPAGHGGTWNPDGVIVFAPAGETPLYRVSASGGTPVPVTKLAEDGRFSHRFPQFLPDGRRFLFLARGQKAEASALVAGSLDEGPLQTIVEGYSTTAEYVEPGWLALTLNQSLVVRRFDASSLELSGEPVAVRPGVFVDDVSGSGSFSFSHAGVLAFRSDAQSTGSTVLQWYSRAGAAESVVGDPGGYTVPQLSPDGRRLAVASGSSVWIRDLVRGTASRLSGGPGYCCPVWSPDGAYVAFRRGPRDLGMMRASGTGDELVLLSDEATNVPTSWSPDGRLIVYEARGRGRGVDVLMLPLQEPRTPRPLLAGAANEMQGRVSPDGRWIAYTSDESGRPEVYIQDFPALSDKWQVSTAGGADPQWRRDATELFFVSADHQLMAVALSGGRTLELGIPAPLFQVRVTGLTDVRAHYQVSADGRRFLVNAVSEAERGAPIQVLANWPALLAR